MIVRRQMAYYCLFLLLLLLTISDAYKILVFSPVTSKSHLISNGRIADELVRAGNDVVGLEDADVF